MLHGHNHRSQFFQVPGPDGPIPVVGVRSASNSGKDPEKRAHYHLYDVEPAARDASGPRFRIRVRARGYDPKTRRDRIKRKEDGFPKGGVAMRVHVRDLPREGLPADWRAKAWNIDCAWFRGAELRTLMPANVKKNAVQPWPQPLVDRVFRLHLTDFVRGQTVPYKPKNVHEATLQTEVTKVKKGSVEVRFTGRARLCSGPWTDRPDGGATRGADVTVLGKATWDRRRDGFTAFELVAVGLRWGETQFNFRQDDLDPAPIGWVFTLAPEGERVAPAALGDYGW